MRGQEYPRALLPSVPAPEAPWPSCYRCGGPIAFDYGGAQNAHELAALEHQEARGDRFLCAACLLEWLRVAFAPKAGSP